MEAALAIAVPPNARYVRPWLYPKQEAAIFCPERYAVIEASTKSGKTVGCIIWLTEQAMRGKPGWNYWWIAPIHSQAKIAYKRLIRTLPKWAYHPNHSEQTITLKNGCIIWFKSADNPDSLYGDDVHAAVIDEASRCKEEAWWAVRSTLTATAGPIRVIGNVKGRKNWAYHLARRAESGSPGMKYSRITVFDAVAANIVRSTEIEDARAALPDDVFRELYLAEPQDNAGNPFGGEPAIRRCIGDLSMNTTVMWGVDLAKSSDWTVCIGLDTEGAVTAVERWQGPWEETIDRIVALCGSTPALVDSTGVGDPVLEALQKRGRPGNAKFSGFHFASGSKQQLMEGLAVAIQQRHLTFPEGVVTQELESFEYAYTRTGATYSAPPGLKDDAVCSLALAVKGWNALSSRKIRIWGGAIDAPMTQEEITERNKNDLDAAIIAASEAVDTDRWFPGR